MSSLTVSAFNVLFGDALFITVPDFDPDRRREVRRSILIDFGNAAAGHGGEDDVFLPVMRNIMRRLDGAAVDLYVLTHEHLDHSQGLPYLAARHDMRLPIDYGWFPASAAPDYYKRHPNAKKQLATLRTELARIQQHLAVMRPSRGLTSMRLVLANNDPRRTSDCVAFLREQPRRRATFVHRGLRLRRGLHHPFREASFRILAPEEDTSVYYGRLAPTSTSATQEALTPPAGVDPRGFRRLLESWKTGTADNLLAIDRAANNTSIVFELEWRGWRLLFTGDAELRSWRTMHRSGALEPVHFIKVGHHGSENGTPPADLLASVLPLLPPDDRPRTAIVSTCEDTYNGVPSHDVLKRLAERCDRVLQTNTLKDGRAWDVEFEG